MIALDANILLYAYDARSPFHKSARKHFESLLSGTAEVGIPIQCIYAFVRLITNPAISGKRVSLQHALDSVNEWLSFRHVQILYPGRRHWQILERLATEGHATGNLIADAAIAAIAIEYGAVIHTNDRDFARFSDVRWINPLVA